VCKKISNLAGERVKFGLVEAAGYHRALEVEIFQTTGGGRLDDAVTSGTAGAARG
jgi:hypothetical protein